jgi:tetratricopeptide (TPR) repeat protein
VRSAALAIACCAPLLVCGCGGSERSPEVAAAVADAAISDAIAAAEKALDDQRLADAQRLARFATAEVVAGARPTQLVVAAHELLGRVELARASAADAAGRRDDAASARRSAADAYVVASARAPDDAALADAAGLVLDAAGDRAGALAHYDRAIALAPRHIRYRLHRGQLHLRTGDLVLARADADAMREAAPNEPWGHGLAADIAIAQEDIATATAAAARAIELAPQEASFRLLLARAHRKGGRADQAIESLVGLPLTERATEAMAFELAAAWTALGRHDKAAETWGDVYRANPGLGSLRSVVEAGLAAAKAGDLRQAAAWRDTAQLLAPEDPRLADLDRAIADARDRPNDTDTLAPLPRS